MESEQPYLGDLLTMVINQLLTGMILQVGIPDFNYWFGLVVCIPGIPLWNGLLQWGYP